MLNYSIKLGDEYIKKDVVVWGEKYLSPDLSFISGVTSQDYHLEKQTQIEASINGKSDLLNIECENVRREGYVIVKGKRYDASPLNDSIFINGKYYYINSGKITVDNWLVQQFSVKKDYNPSTQKYDKRYFVPGVTTDTKTVNAVKNPSTNKYYAQLDTIYWIEDGKVTIDGNQYFFDRDEITSNSRGALKYFEDGAALSYNEITNCTGIECYPIEKGTDFIDVTKFKLVRDEDRIMEVENVTFVSHFFYALYGEEVYPIELSGSNYICKIGDTSYNVKIYEGGSSSSDGVDATTANVEDYEALYDYDCYVYISDSCKLKVEKTIQNSNTGRKLGIYLSGTYDNINIGEIITARRDDYSSYDTLDVEELDGEYFVVHDGSRYKVVADMMSTVVINDVEYEIKRCDSTNCFVEIDGEEVPMKKNGSTLERYGLVIKDANSSPEKATYNIKSYSGVTIEGKDYRVLPAYDNETDGTQLLVSYTIPAEPGIVHRLRVLETVGSSLLVCEPVLYEDEFSSDYLDAKISEIAGDMVYYFKDMTIFKKNQLFGEREVLPQNGKIMSNTPTSSDDFQNVLGTLKLYAKIGYINIPIKFEAGIEPNSMIDDTRDKDFAEYETQKAINPIIDMERDVYSPKYIDNSDESIQAYLDYLESLSADTATTEIAYGDTGATEILRHVYIGSFTDFKPVIEIQVNPHFRTRNFSNWKVNDGYNDASTSGITDNWFVTDYEPYKSILTATTEQGTPVVENGEQLIEVADTIGMLYFTNLDVYYQKTAVAKTFLRFSYYDGTNPQTQSLLHTSTVFMNEHDLFKKFIDNSRKNVYDYMLAQEPMPEEHDEETGEEVKYEEHPSIINKISVMSEFIGTHDKKKIKAAEGGYKFTDADPFNENRRISSRFTIVNKYQTDTSSEGFYLYIFKQYAENLHPKPIYMKIDFNHAKIGKTIPFIIPMKWEKSEEEIDDSPYVYPTERITLSNVPNTGDTGDTCDLEELKQGIPLSYVYGQGYIPLYAMYDFKNKEYVYIFDERYVGEITDGIVKLNLFELKVKNNEDGEAIEKTAVIDINKNQILTE